MSLKIFNPLDAESKRERIIIYGAPGVGKTRFALSVTPRFGELLYYAADDNSHFLDSVADAKKKRVHVLRPAGDDPLQNFQEFAMHDWKKDFPKVETIIVDTYTAVAQKCIQASANMGCVTAEKHFVVGDPKNGGQVIPNRGDYMGMESLSRGFLDALFFYQERMNIIFICHEDVKNVEGMPATGGPSHPGRKMVVELPARFSTVIRLIKEPYLKPGADTAENMVVAITDHDGRFIAKARTHNEGEPSPLGRVMLNRNSENFWVMYDKIYAPEGAGV